MGQIITVVGNAGVGKSTLARALCKLYPFDNGLEQHKERPFQALMKQDPARFALANQVDYLLFRAEQERTLRQANAIGILDGGLDLDFYGFTQLFHGKGYLTPAEFALCQRLYQQQRQLLGPPDLILRLVAPLDVIARRHAQRGRPLEIAQRNDIATLGRFVDEWLDSLPDDACLTVDMAAMDALSETWLQTLLAEILFRLDR